MSPMSAHALQIVSHYPAVSIKQSRVASWYSRHIRRNGSILPILIEIPCCDDGCPSIPRLSALPPY